MGLLRDHRAKALALMTETALSLTMRTRLKWRLSIEQRRGDCPPTESPAFDLDPPQVGRSGVYIVSPLGILIYSSICSEPCIFTGLDAACFLDFLSRSLQFVRAFPQHIPDTQFC